MKSLKASPLLIVLGACSNITVVKPTEAFAPPQAMGSSFVQTRALVSHPSSFPSSSPSRSSSSSSSALQMGLFDRFTRVTKSNINNILRRWEDPEKILNQAMEDMQSDLIKVRQSFAEITATQRRLYNQKEQSNTLAQDWYERAQLALKASNDPLAREALMQRQKQLEISADLQSQIDVQTKSIDRLYEGMRLLEQRIREAKSKKEQMVARARTAQSTQQLNDMLGGLTGKTSMDAFRRMEDKVEALEAAADVAIEMNRAIEGGAKADLEREFKLLEASSSVDEELARMKKSLMLNPAGENSNISVAITDKETEKEFEKLKAKAGLK